MIDKKATGKKINLALKIAVKTEIITTNGQHKSKNFKLWLYILIVLSLTESRKKTIILSANIKIGKSVKDKIIRLITKKFRVKSRLSFSLFSPFKKVYIRTIGGETYKYPKTILIKPKNKYLN